MLTALNMIKRFFSHPWLKTEEGQTTIEYVLVIVLIAVAIIIAFFTTNIEEAITTVAGEIADAIESADSSKLPGGS